MKIAAKSDVGNVRTNNEDAYLVDAQLGLLIVADGMGGHVGGEVASALAAETIAAVVKERLSGAEDPGQIGQLLREAIQTAHAEVCARAAANPALHEMGTTVVVALCQGDTVHIAHVGDSRAYRLHRGDVQQLTEDHSVVAQLIKAGQLTPKEARHYPLRHQITRCLGGPDTAQPDLQCLTWERGDSLLLCSDGLTNMVDDRNIRKLLLKGGEDVQASCEALVELANASGGQDNTTVIVACRE